MRKRGVGVAAAKNKSLAEARYKNKGNELEQSQLAEMAKQMEMFKVNLEDFAAKHKDDIKKDPQFRVNFQEMCASIGVDPLASSKGFWAEMLGVGDFYYELGVQIIEVCMATNHRNGGLISIEELRDKVTASRGKKSQPISIDDLLRAIKKLKILGNGFTVIALGKSYMVQSVPGELTMDHTKLLQEAQNEGFVSKKSLMSSLKWEEERASRALEYMVKEGLAWVDDQASDGRQYWFPSFFPEISSVT
ncbi:vacuolar-sorting protein SNF8-like [Saccostrea cucullata]|uniref:vacuolar-sorting protein SNF8-like n=1 Tax=Saccostrea cuccullata TaxID=36930 RepID=UPI002ED2A1F8